MAFFDGVFVPLNPGAPAPLPLTILNPAFGAYTYIEFRGDYALGLAGGGTQPTETARTSVPLGQFDGSLTLTHRPPVFPPVDPTAPIWQIFQNNRELTEFAFRVQINAADLDGDYGVFVRPLPFTPGDDRFDFGRFDYPEYLIDPEPTPFLFRPLFDSAGLGDDVVRLWAKGSVYARHLTAFDGGAGDDRITAGTAAVALSGGEGNDTLTGGAGRDTVSGGAGDDVIAGGRGRDVLSGGIGADTFRFDAPDARRNPDRIGDFDSGIDLILLDRALFPELDLGALPDRAFKAVGPGGGRLDASDRIVFERDTGRLLYDPDGDPPGPGRGAGAVVIALLNPFDTLTADDFRIV